MLSCATKIAATASYKAVPSIFTVAPSGNTKPEVERSIPASSVQVIVKGKVALEEAVEKAVNNASDIDFINLKGDLCATIHRIIGNEIKA